MAEEPATPKGVEGQTFLVGETIYLRGLEKDDAKRAAAWRESHFPVTSARAEELLKEAVSGEEEQTGLILVACRNDGDLPVGSAKFQSWNRRTGTLSLWTDPGLGPRGAEIRAEMLRLIVPWQVDERQLMLLWVFVDSDDAVVMQAAESIGMVQAARLREAIWRNGKRQDQVIYHQLNSHWVERLGDPGPGIEEASEPRVGQPHAFEDVVQSPAPIHNATIVGQRLVLRPHEIEDAPTVARWMRQETELYWSRGRQIISAVGLSQWFRKRSEQDPPTEIEFGLALRETGELIGENGLYEIDWIHRTAETGSYIYRPEHRNGGFGTEAKHLLLAYAFDRLGLHMVRSFVWEPNTRSAAALRKQGYRDAGRHRWAGPQNGQYADMLVFDLLAEEWRASRQS